MVTEIIKELSKGGTTAVQNIVLCYDISADWILTGKGDMIRKDDIVQNHQPKSVEKISEDQEILLYDIAAAANLKTLLINKDQNILGAIKIPDAPKCDGAIYVSGDSMYPLLKSGDIIAFKAVYNLQYLIYGEMYLVAFEIDGEEYLTVKYINKTEDPETIKLVSYNTHHQPMDIPVAAIRSLAIVKFSIRKNMMI